MNSDTLYSTQDKHCYCKQVSVFSTALKNFADATSTVPTSIFADFSVVDEDARSNSGKTVNIYVNKNGKRCFIRQAPHRNLRALLNSQSLKDEKCKYQKTNKGEMYARAK